MVDVGTTSVACDGLLSCGWVPERLWTRFERVGRTLERARLLRPTAHLALATGAGLATWLGTGEPLALPVAVGAGVLVDGDHLPDMVSHFYLGRRPTVTFILHAWEWLLILTVVSVWLGFPWWSVAALVGYGSHVVTDSLFNGGKLPAYSIVYRAYHRFDPARIGPDWRLGHPVTELLRELHLGRRGGE